MAAPFKLVAGVGGCLPVGFSGEPWVLVLEPKG